MFNPANFKNLAIPSIAENRFWRTCTSSSMSWRSEYTLSSILGVSNLTLCFQYQKDERETCRAKKTARRSREPFERDGEIGSRSTTREMTTQRQSLTRRAYVWRLRRFDKER